MLKVALTGGIGSGKSEAGNIFKSLGAIVVDSDQLSRDVIERGTPGFDEVIENFGDEILTEGDIDRKKLGDIVFNNPEKRILLEKIIHPRVREAFNSAVAAAGENSIIINQIPLLVETDGGKNFDSVITISTPATLRRERLIKRGLKGLEVDKRMAAQVSDAEREAISEFVIDNSGDEFELQSQVENIYRELKSRASSN
jgi:dephospho-CoA kinase